MKCIAVHFLYVVVYFGAAYSVIRIDTSIK